MQRDRKVVAASWLATAERDLRVGHATLAIEPSLSAFHAQQAAEKALKAMLVLVADDHPRTHAATTLVRELIVSTHRSASSKPTRRAVNHGSDASPLRLAIAAGNIPVIVAEASDRIALAAFAERATAVLDRLQMST